MTIIRSSPEGGMNSLYIFLDEGGNLDFSLSGTKFFTLTSVTKCRPFALDDHLLSLKYDLLEEGLMLERFHASEDRQHVRNRVFEKIADNLASIRIDSIVVEKRKTQPQLHTKETFYAVMLGFLLKHVFKETSSNRHSQVIVTTDTLPLKSKREAFEKAIKTTLVAMLPPLTKYKVLHHDSRSSMSLQVTDYCNWAIFRKWSSGDTRSHELIRKGIKSEFDIFRTGETFYY